GFRGSDPRTPVTDLTAQADALSSLLDTPAGVRVILVGHSYGGPIATLMAARYPEKVSALILAAPYFGVSERRDGFWFWLNKNAPFVMPRRARGALAEVQNQRAQLPAVEAVVGRLPMPVYVMHGDRDAVIPMQSSERIAVIARTQLVIDGGGTHALAYCCVTELYDLIDRAIAGTSAAP
ncbi:MAG: alpha/beta fold hydrolase, partial [Caulobacterales bacterium]